MTMPERTLALLLLLASLLLSPGYLPAAETVSRDEKSVEEEPLSATDSEIIDMLELLQMLELLKNMDVLAMVEESE